MSTRRRAYFVDEMCLGHIRSRPDVAETQKRMFDHVLEMNLAFDQRRPSNHLITVIAHGANAARDMLNLTAVSFGRDAMTPGGLVPVMVAQEPVMSAICLGCQAACSVGNRARDC